jgi:hypothetical protein
MRSRVHARRLLLGLAAILASCGDDAPAPATGPSSLAFLAHVDRGCAFDSGGVFDCVRGASLTGVEAAGDTLVLWIRFEANCCPGFTESAAYAAGDLTIAVVDTLHGCRCLCSFENPFRFLCAGTGPVRLRFQNREAPDAEYCLSGLDTTFVVPPG